MAGFLPLAIDSNSDTPVYRQLARAIEQAIADGSLARGARLPATRELAVTLGLNRTTVTAAYAALEEAGLIEGQVGRGSFVAGMGSPAGSARELPVRIDFANSRPSADSFPLAGFRRLSREIIDSPEVVNILQLGSPYGYGPLRRYLLEQGEAAGWVRPEDDLIVTNGCQQAIDLLARVLVEAGDPVAVEDPMYRGLLEVFGQAGAKLTPVPVGQDGLDIEALERTVDERKPRLLFVTPEFQNPTGATLGLAARKAIVRLAERTGLLVIESEVYRRLRYQGQALPSLKQLDTGGRVISLASYSKVAFPGLRVGWMVGPRAAIGRLAAAKQRSDLHSDQLSQAILHRFAASGELERHLEAARRLGLERLEATVAACKKYLPSGARFTRPEGGMNLWIELPAPLESAELQRAAEEAGVRFLAGGHFSVDDRHRHGLRLSFGGVPTHLIEPGIRLLGETARRLLGAGQERAPLEPLAAVV